MRSVRNPNRSSNWLVQVATGARSYLRYNHFLFASVLISAVLSFWAAYGLRFDFDVPPDYAHQCFIFLPYVAAIKLSLFYFLGGHSTDWRYVGMADTVSILAYAAAAAGALLLISSLQLSTPIPRGVIIIDFLLTLVLTGGIRLSARYFREQVMTPMRNGKAPFERKAIIIGAGDAGEMILREIKRNPRSGFNVLAFFDDDPDKKGMSIHGIRVLGATEDVRAYVKLNPVDIAIVAIPSANRSQMRRINSTLKDLNLSIKTLPPLVEIVEKSSALTQLRDINITDLLGREEIRIDTGQVHDLIHDKVVLVTGAGGSIGSELCRQVARRGPRKLLVLDRSENSLFHIHRKLLKQAAGGNSSVFVPLLRDLTDEKMLLHELQEHRPHLVFHSAAHKHVAMQEFNALECFRNNVGGLLKLVLACDHVGVERFVLISTDKAVNPTSVMGATKRACEIYCQAFSHITPTKLICVRFGNVLASEGSVVPLFLEQIGEGGPVTVTHPEVKRYFMTIPEAVTLVLQAAALGESGQIMVLDMGEPLKIADLARQLIVLAGKTEDEILIEFTGLKPGEKLKEQLRFGGEVITQTSHEKIKIFNENVMNHREVIARIDAAVQAVTTDPYQVDARHLLQELVPEFQPELHQARETD